MPSLDGVDLSPTYVSLAQNHIYSLFSMKVQNSDLGMLLKSWSLKDYNLERWDLLKNLDK